jgi:hypothetical protein
LIPWVEERVMVTPSRSVLSKAATLGELPEPALLDS